MNNVTIDLTPLVQALISLLAILITTKLIPWLKSKLTGQQQSNLAAAARIVVYAAQQIFGSEKIQELNEDKYKYALARMKQMGFDLDEKILRAAIEQAVYEMKQQIGIVEAAKNAGTFAPNFTLLDGVDVKDLNEEQLREALRQVGETDETIDQCKDREAMEDLLEEHAENGVPVREFTE